MEPAEHHCWEAITQPKLVGAEVEDLSSEEYVGCECSNGRCDGSTRCSCIEFSLGNSFLEDGRLVFQEFSDSQKPIIQCSRNCYCSAASCLNRVIGGSNHQGLSVFHSGDKGMGIRTEDKIPRGMYICEYLGEFLDADEAKKRLLNLSETSHNYTIIVREHFHSSLGERVVGIDARSYGNIARFVNHSCDPNACLIIGHAGNDLPRVGLFAMRDIEPGEEICFDYGSLNSSISTTPCHCNSAVCRKFLPMDQL